jgi:hypothetical protein
MGGICPEAEDEQDADGNRMTPTHAVKKGTRYHRAGNGAIRNPLENY